MTLRINTESISDFRCLSSIIRLSPALSNIGSPQISRELLFLTRIALFLLKDLPFFFHFSQRSSRIIQVSTTPVPTILSEPGASLARPLIHAFFGRQHSIFWFSTSKKDLSELTIRLLLQTALLAFFVIRNLSYLGSRILIIRMGKALPSFGDEVGPSLLCQF